MKYPQTISSTTIPSFADSSFLLTAMVGKAIRKPRKRLPSIGRWERDSAFFFLELWFTEYGIDWVQTFWTWCFDLYKHRIDDLSPPGSIVLFPHGDTLKGDGINLAEIATNEIAHSKIEKKTASFAKERLTQKTSKCLEARLENLYPDISRQHAIHFMGFEHFLQKLDPILSLNFLTG